MNIIRNIVLPLVLVSVMGCATPETRIRKEPELFASFPPEVQAKVRQGQIAIGFSQAEVRMALGDPDRVYHRATTSSTNEIWSYTALTYRTFPQYSTAFTPFPEPWPNSAYIPGVVLLDVQERDEYEALRVEFENGRVKAIETRKR